MAVRIGHGLTGAVDSRQYVHWSESQLNCHGDGGCDDSGTLTGQLSSAGLSCVWLQRFTE